MRAIDLAVKDLLQMVRDWKTAMFLVVMPAVFTLLFGFAFGGFGGGETDPRLPVGYVDRDSWHPVSSRLLGLLATSDSVRPVVLEGRDAQEDRIDEQVKNEDLAGVLIVPPGYGESLLAGDLLRAMVVIDPGAGAGSTAQGEIQAAVARLAGSIRASELSLKAYEAQAGAASEAERQAFLGEALDRAIAAWEDPPLTVDARQSGAAVAEEPSSMQNGFSHTSPSMMVQFALAGLIGAASVLVLERKSGALRRLLTTTISRVEILLGHYVAVVAIILMQFVILVAFGQFVLAVDYLREPLATLLVMVATALWTAALGLLIGSLAKNDEQVTIFSLVPMFVLAGMGGAWVPLEFTGKAFQTIGHLLPTAWAMDGFENIVIRGLGLGSVLIPVAVMLGYAVALLALAVWLFRFE